MGLSGAANADAMLAQDDFVGISFWVISMGMLAATAFCFMDAGNVASGWRTSVIVAGLVTGIAFIHYMYMRDVWVSTGDSPTVYRYIDWLITAITDDRVLLNSNSCKKSKLWNFLEIVNWIIGNVNRWILRRSWTSS
jgi:hypothetical protein